MYYFVLQKYIFMFFCDYFQSQFLKKKIMTFIQQLQNRQISAIIKFKL